MFSNWEETYKNWKKENENNPDHLYVENYKQQMEAMRLQLLEKRKKLQLSAVMLENWHSETGTVKIDNGYESVKEEVSNLPSNEEQIKKILDANDYDEDSEEEEKPAAEPSKVKRSRWGNDEMDEVQEKNVKKSRWNNEDEEDNLDIDMMRRRPEPFNNQQSFQPRPSLLDHPRPNFNQNEAMFNERNFGGPPRGFGGPQRGFGGPIRGMNGPQRGLGGPSRGFNGMQRGLGGPIRGFGFRGGPRPTFNNFQNHPRHQQPPDFENFWKPTEVKDYSQNPSSFSQDREFKPQTFDYSHGNKNREPREPMTVSKPATLSGKCVMIDSILSAEGRASRPVKVVIILRGVPGSGKSHLAKLIKDKEVEAGGDQPRTMSLDDYFTVDGEYEYEEDMEEAYRASLLKSFKKNIDAGLFSFLILDAVHNKTCQFKDFWSYAKQHGYEVYVCTVECDPVLAASRNIHKRSEQEVIKLHKTFEETPGHMNTLDVRSLLQDDAIEHVEMVEAEDENCEKASNVSQNDEEDEESEDQTFLRASKWEILDKEEKLARLDGTGEKMRSKMSQHSSIEDWLELGSEIVDRKPTKLGQKRVRWADIEQRRTQAKVAQFGFVVGQTNWASQEDIEAAASSALTTTKIIPNRFQSEFHN